VPSGEEVGSWPDGTYEADAYVDNDPAGNEDLHVHVAVTVEGDHLTVDFTGSDTRQRSRAGPRSATRAAT
jgi:N-methylhydantoinase B